MSATLLGFSQQDLDEMAQIAKASIGQSGSVVELELPKSLQRRIEGMIDAEVTRHLIAVRERDRAIEPDVLSLNLR